MTPQDRHHTDFNAQYDCIANIYAFDTNLWLVVTSFTNHKPIWCTCGGQTSHASTTTFQT